MKYTKDLLNLAHKKCGLHREDVLRSEICGCFYCNQYFKPIEIEEWTDEDDNQIGQTAICPKCGIDSVIGSGSNVPIFDIIFLQEMNKYFF